MGVGMIHEVQSEGLWGRGCVGASLRCIVGFIYSAGASRDVIGKSDTVIE